MIRYYLARICHFLCGRLPSRISYRLASLGGEVMYLSWPRARSCLWENMAHVLGPRASRGEIRATARRALRNFCQSAVDFARMSRLKGKDFETRVLFKGWENIDRALERGKGAILVGLHQGSWEVAAAAITSRGYPLNVIADNPPSAWLSRFVDRLRARWGVKVISTAGQGAAARVLHALRRNEVLALLIDRPAPENGVPVEFFQSPIVVPAGAAFLSLKTGAPVMTGGLVRLRDARVLGFIEQEISFEPGDNLTDDIRALTQAIVTSLERMVRRYPDQWYMFRRLWV